MNIRNFLTFRGIYDLMIGYRMRLQILVLTLILELCHSTLKPKNLAIKSLLRTIALARQHCIIVLRIVMAEKWKRWKMFMFARCAERSICERLHSS